METVAQHQEILQYAEAYISDILMLKNIFLQTHDGKKVNQNFGLPFLLAKKENKTIAFASLVMNGKGLITFKIYNKMEMTDTEMEIFFAHTEVCFKKNNSPNFRNPEQLKSSISRMVSWLNLE
ncbi:hypothetical protein LF887_23290 [Chryseobacterium sp. MEBOG06]|uniref:hypothetical protein n=1 Tax=Chryseobacterium sp. MEBOG06 TaxID=2879938 RepID=UPI001F2D6EAA|nr:hypothetical protein [Chryseobacterium sp. MEBOG06]UKB83888.1 hypothetical protein LF887_23290 [Chryseobacterium sp. MEBOG06]